MTKNLDDGKDQLSRSIRWADEEDDRQRESSPYTTPSANIKHVVLVMDALQEFSIELLQWTLDHVIGTGYVITLLGVMPWLNLLLSSKTRLDVWTLDHENLPAILERSESNNDLKYQKLREIVELCDKYGVTPYMKVVMGHPSKLLILEQTTSLHATWVVFDRHHWKNKSFYAKRLPCNVAMMNSNGEVNMLKVRTVIIDNRKTTTTNPAEESSRSLASLVRNSKMIFSEILMTGFNRRRRHNRRSSNKFSMQQRHDKSSFSCLSM
ncbi:hypothetical protein BVC80_9073g121 [Macleaya cordata]|uniref:Uncharacterized protein n=1 Tax=Macleaya cordata TaxID=56857 RepID=A0A200PTZ1_MACCD|nr:hypothetical protein BVC80_9073g121 [Macleaya cordata]